MEAGWNVCVRVVSVECSTYSDTYRIRPQRPSRQNRWWKLFGRHTTMALIILYLVYSQVSTVVSSVAPCLRWECRYSVYAVTIECFAVPLEYHAQPALPYALGHHLPQYWQHAKGRGEGGWRGMGDFVRRQLGLNESNRLQVTRVERNGFWAPIESICRIRCVCLFNSPPKAGFYSL